MRIKTRVHGSVHHWVGVSSPVAALVGSGYTGTEARWSADRIPTQVISSHKRPSLYRPAGSQEPDRTCIDKALRIGNAMPAGSRSWTIDGEAPSESSYGVIARITVSSERTLRIRCTRVVERSAFISEVLTTP
jgi:hypothetical protein